MNLRNFWKDFNSNFDRHGVGSKVAPLLPLVPQMGQEVVRAFISHWQDKTKFYRLSELDLDHLVMKYWLTSNSPREFLSQNMYFVMEACEKFLTFQKKQNPQLERLEFVLEQIETELFEIKPKKMVKLREVQLKLHWPCTELEYLRAKLESQGQRENFGPPSLSEQLPVQIFNNDGIKLAHFSLRYRVELIVQAQIARKS